jgi:hypothetical protein
MLTINPSSSLIIYVMTATNKRLPISKSHGDSNQCTPCREKPDQHATRFPRLVCVWSTTTRISCGPHIATVHTIINRFEKIHCTREEGLLTQSTARRLTDPRVCTQLPPTTVHGAVGKSQASIDIWLLGLLGPYHQHVIGTFNTCSRGPTHRSFTDIGRATTLEVSTCHIPLLDLPHQLSPLSTSGPCPDSSLTKFHHLNQSVEY